MNLLFFILTAIIIVVVGFAILKSIQYCYIDLHKKIVMILKTIQEKEE